MHPTSRGATARQAAVPHEPGCRPRAPAAPAARPSYPQEPAAPPRPAAGPPDPAPQGSASREHTAPSEHPTVVSAACQRRTSAPRDACGMTPEDSHLLIRQLVSGDPAAATAILTLATTSTEPLVLTAAALIEPTSSSLLDRARSTASTTRDRQLAALAAAHITGDDDLVSALAREHLLD